MTNALTRWVPALLLGAGCIMTLGSGRQRQIPLPRPLATIPFAPEGWTAKDVVIGEAERITAGMDTYVLREYRPAADSAGVPWTIYVGYYEAQSQGKSIHSPKNCLPGAGWEPLQSGPLTIQTARGPQVVNKYLIQNKGQQAVVLYWYQGRGRVAWNEYRVKLDLLRDAAMKGRTDEALVRIVVPVVPGKVDDAMRLAVAQARELIPAVDTVLPGA